MFCEDSLNLLHHYRHMLTKYPEWLFILNNHLGNEGFSKQWYLFSWMAVSKQKVLRPGNKTKDNKQTGSKRRKEKTFKVQEPLLVNLEAHFLQKKYR